jgi:hypothetical protein
MANPDLWCQEMIVADQRRECSNFNVLVRHT